MSNLSFRLVFAQFLYLFAFSSLRFACLLVAGLKKPSFTWQGSVANYPAAYLQGLGVNCGRAAPTIGPANINAAAAAAFVQLLEGSCTSTMSVSGIAGAADAVGISGSGCSTINKSLFLAEDDISGHVLVPCSGSGSSSSAGHVMELPYNNDNSNENAASGPGAFMAVNCLSCSASAGSLRPCFFNSEKDGPLPLCCCFGPLFVCSRKGLNHLLPCENPGNALDCGCLLSGTPPSVKQKCGSMSLGSGSDSKNDDVMGNSHTGNDDDADDGVDDGDDDVDEPGGGFPLHLTKKIAWPWSASRVSSAVKCIAAGMGAGSGLSAKRLRPSQDPHSSKPKQAACIVLQLTDGQKAKAFLKKLVKCPRVLLPHVTYLCLGNGVPLPDPDPESPQSHGDICIFNEVLNHYGLLLRGERIPYVACL